MNIPRISNRKYFFSRTLSLGGSLLFLLLVWNGCQKQETPVADEGGSKLVLQRVSLERAIEAMGKVTPFYTVEVKSKASGEITSMPLPEGSLVQKGQLLAQLDPIDEYRNVSKQEASLEQSQVSLEKTIISLEKSRFNLQLKKREASLKVDRTITEYNIAKSDLERAKKLFEQKLASDKEVETAQIKYTQALFSKDSAVIEQENLKTMELDINGLEQDVKSQKSRLRQEELNLEIARLRLEETQILSPIDGVILKRMVEPGQIISSGISNVGGGTTLLKLADVNTMYLETEVDESDISFLEPGQEVSIIAEAFIDQKFHGTVIQIAPMGETVQNVTVFQVRIQLGRKAIQMLKPGMNATARIVYLNKDNIIAVPTNAIVRQENKFGVMKLDEKGQQIFTEVKTGVRDEGNIEIFANEYLKEGDSIFVPAKNNDRLNGSRGMGMNMGRMMPRAR